VARKNVETAVHVDSRSCFNACLTVIQRIHNGHSAYCCTVLSIKTTVLVSPRYFLSIASLTTDITIYNVSHVYILIYIPNSSLARFSTLRADVKVFVGIAFYKTVSFRSCRGFETIPNVYIYIIELGHTLYAEAMPVCS
jgi:hypothetical protein